MINKIEILPKTQEVEITAKIDQQRRKMIEQTLLTMGAERIGEYSIVDLYLCPFSVNDFEEIEMNEVGSYSLRLRQEQTLDTIDRVTLNTKVITQPGDHRSWEEHEVDVQSMKEAISIFTSIGFKVFFRLEKVRTSYKYQDMTICFDYFDDDFGTVIEVEIITDQPSAESSKKKILKLLDELTVSESDLYEKSATNELMKLKASF